MSLSGPDDRLQLRDEAAAEVLQLALAQLRRVDDHAALGAAVRQIDDRALPGHPHGEGADLVQRDGRRIADAALVGSAGVVVLHAIAGEGADAAVVHLHGEVDGELPFGALQAGQDALVQAEQRGGGVELLQRRLVGIGLRALRVQSGLGRGGHARASILPMWDSAGLGVRFGVARSGLVAAFPDRPRGAAPRGTAPPTRRALRRPEAVRRRGSGDRPAR